MRGRGHTLLAMMIASGLGPTIACVTGGRFACVEDVACREGTVQGTCEAVGFCSFPDRACASGARFSRFAPDGVAGRCTDAAPPDSDAGTGTVGTGSFGTESGGTDSDVTGMFDVGPAAERAPHDVVCGDGLVDAEEACDDANSVDGDGCNNDCVISGTPLWTVVENGQAGGDDVAFAVALLPGGDIVATGRTAGDAGDAWMARFDPDTGENIRAWQFGAALNDEGRAIATDAASNIYVVGSTGAAATGRNMFLRVYYDELLDGGVVDGGVELQWNEGISSPMDADDFGRAVALREGAGEVVVAGVLGRVADPGHTEAYARSFATDEDEIRWTQAQGLGDFGSEARAVTVTADGRTFLAGTVRTGSAHARTDGWLGEIELGTPTGTVGFAWTERIGEGPTTEVINALSQLPTGELLVGGRLDDRGFWGVWTPDGVELTRVVPPGRGASEIRGIAADGTGAVVTVGQRATANGLDIEVVKYEPGGGVLWTDLRDGDAHSDDRAHAVVIADDGAIVVAGQIREPVSLGDIWLCKYAP